MGLVTTAIPVAMAVPVACCSTMQPESVGVAQESTSAAQADEETNSHEYDLLSDVASDALFSSIASDELLSEIVDTVSERDIVLRKKGRRSAHNATERRRVDKLNKLFREVRHALHMPDTATKSQVLHRVLEYVHQTQTRP